MTDAVKYLVMIEGVGNGTGQIRFCYDAVPGYASANAAYVAGLAEPPTGWSSHWQPENDTVDVGRFSLTFREGVGPFRWLQTRPRAASELREDLDASETGIDHAKTNTAAGIDTTAPIYVDRETILPTTATGSATTVTGTRGYAGSTAAAHNDGADIFLRPPALTGRRVTVYEVPVDAASASEEVVILRGFVDSEPASPLTGFPTIEVVERFDVGLLNEAPESYPFANSSGALPKGGGSSAAGGYWYFPDTSAAIAGTYDSGATRLHWALSAAGVVYHPDWAGFGYAPRAFSEEEEQALGFGGAYQILYSNVGAPYPSFGYTPDGGSYTQSDNPIVIALNLLTSLDGSNAQSGRTNYDLGATSSAGGLYPEFAVGVDADLIDLDVWEDALDGDLAGVHADRFWLGGPDSESLDSVFRRLLGPFGYAVGTTRTGLWTLVRLYDVYPDESVVALDEQHLSLPRITQLEFVALSRRIDAIILETDPSPDGQTSSTHVVEEVTGRDYYPPHVGGTARFERSPYSLSQFEDGQPSGILVAPRMRRLADVAQVIQLPLTAKGFDLVDLGTAVTVHDISVRDPVTGDRLVSADDPLKGRVIGAEINWLRRTATCRVILTDTDARVALHGASAKITSWDGGTDTATCYSRLVTHGGDDDAPRFADDDVVRIVDTHFASLSATTQIVQSTTAGTLSDDATIVLDGDFGVTPADGNWIVPADYDDVTATQQASYAWDADGGAPASGAPGLGATPDDPYVVGD